MKHDLLSAGESSHLKSSPLTILGGRLFCHSVELRWSREGLGQED